MGTLYESIKSLCDTAGIKPGKMCVDLEISKSMMTKLKNGTKRDIQTDTAQKIADYFGVSVDRVLGSEQKEKAADPEVSGLTPEQLEVIRLFDSADPIRRQIALDILRAAEAAGKAGDTP